ncbi:hypothetical protein DVH24_018539 [Malus domestica]|uniref:Uncharacterized protein n=1 Tax=Malus domestica TaxID=3750 RepID=A0A498KR23_MALDO|nr:hypothetical protein DVH24_004303 [Malus domestica]RXI09214.1 hypothetical protein DVH24_023375 [Malus domestica]RXI10087.1 hypothetical protein DVH24_018539 [Malus domestica]
MSSERPIFLNTERNLRKMRDYLKAELGVLCVIKITGEAPNKLSKIKVVRQETAKAIIDGGR